MALASWCTCRDTISTISKHMLLSLRSSLYRPSLALFCLRSLSTEPMSASLPDVMKCVMYGDLKTVKTDQAVPKPKKGHILVRVEAAGLNPVDAKNVLGDKLPHTWKKSHALLQKSIRSSIPGFDFAGVCVQSSSEKYKPGDRVFGTMPPFGGTLAEYVCAPLDQITPMPENLSFEQAAALPLVGLTALQCCKPHVKQDAKVLVLGASGGTGHVMTQVVKCLGATVIVAVCSPRNFDFCKERGATHLIDYNSETLLDEIKAVGPYSLVLDCVTSEDPRDQTLSYPTMLQGCSGLLEPDYVYRRLGGRTPDWFRAGVQRTTGIKLWPNGHEQLFWIRFPKSSDELKELAGWAEGGLLAPHIAKTYQLNEVADAFETILSRRVTGKVIVVIKQE